MSVYRMGGPTSAFEKDSAARVATLNRVMGQKSKELKAIIEGAIATPQRSTAYWNAVRRTIDRKYAEMLNIFTAWARKEIPGKVKRELYAIQKLIGAMGGLTNKPSLTTASLLTTPSVKTMTDILINDAVSSMASGMAAGKESLYRITRKTQQAVVNEFLIDRSVAKAIEEGNLRNFTGKLILNDPAFARLYEAVDGEQFIVAGTRRFKPGYYADMVARVKFHEAQANATLQQAANYGTDLVVVSTHNTTTEICQSYEGKIFSVGGKDKRFPVLDQVPPFHPNCLHLLFPQFESALGPEAMQQFSDFSLGKTDRPPYPKGFVPVTRRAA